MDAALKDILEYYIFGPSKETGALLNQLSSDSFDRKKLKSHEAQQELARLASQKEHEASRQFQSKEHELNRLFQQKLADEKFQKDLFLKQLESKGSNLTPKEMANLRDRKRAATDYKDSMKELINHVTKVNDNEIEAFFHKTFGGDDQAKADMLQTLLIDQALTAQGLPKTDLSVKELKHALSRHTNESLESYVNRLNEHIKEMERKTSRIDAELGGDFSPTNQQPVHTNVNYSPNANTPQKPDKNGNTLDSILKGMNNFGTGAAQSLIDLGTGGYNLGRKAIGMDTVKPYQYSDFSNADPKSFMHKLGEITGTVGTGFVPGLGPLKGATWKTALGKNAAQGAAMGAAYGANEDKPLQGAGIGGAIGAGASLLGSGVGAAARGLKNLSQKANTPEAKKILESLEGTPIDIGTLTGNNGLTRLYESTTKNPFVGKGNIIDIINKTDKTKNDAVASLSKNYTPGESITEKLSSNVTDQYNKLKQPYTEGYGKLFDKVGNQKQTIDPTTVKALSGQATPEMSLHDIHKLQSDLGHNIRKLNIPNTFAERDYKAALINSRQYLKDTLANALEKQGLNNEYQSLTKGWKDTAVPFKADKGLYDLARGEVEHQPNIANILATGKKSGTRSVLDMLSPEDKNLIYLKKMGLDNLDDVTASTVANKSKKLSHLNKKLLSKEQISLLEKLQALNKVASRYRLMDKTPPTGKYGWDTVMAVAPSAIGGGLGFSGGALGTLAGGAAGTAAQMGLNKFLTSNTLRNGSLAKQLEMMKRFGDYARNPAIQAPID